MVFSSMIFLWVFLPAVLAVYALAPLAAKNDILLAASLIFYAWGEPKYILLMILSVTINYLFGIALEQKKSRLVLGACVAVNLAILGYFKYFNLFANTLGRFAGRELLAIREIALPIGISFYTFQALSYVIDVYRGENRAQRNYWKLLLYISFFPQLIAGPIVKYHDVEEQIDSRKSTDEKKVYGIKRFIYGLAKKVILSTIWPFTPTRLWMPSC